jgi:hypothetical protein
LRGEVDEFGGAGGWGGGGRDSLRRGSLDGGVGAGGELEVDGAGAECEVGVIEGVGVGSLIGELDGVEGGTDAVLLVVSVEGDFASAGDADAVQSDAGHGGRGVALERAVGGVAGVEGDGVGGIANADVVVEHVVGEAAARAVGLDAEGVVGAVEGEVGDEDLADAANGLAADGHAVSIVKVIVTDGHICGAAGTALDGDVVVSGADEAPGDGDVARAVAGIDAVGVAGEALGRIDFESPDGEAVAVIVRDVEVGRVAEGDAVEGEVVSVVGDEDARDLLTAAGAGLLGEIPRGDGFAEEFFTAACVDDAVSHDGRAGDVVGGDERLASAGAGLIDEAATAGGGGGGEERGIAGGEEGCAFVDDEGDIVAQFERAGEEGVGGGVRAQENALAFAALIHGVLDADGVEPGLVSLGEGAAGGGSEFGNAVELGVEREADGRQDRLGDGARVLGGEKGREAEGEEGEDETAGHSLLLVKRSDQFQSTWRGEAGARLAVTHGSGGSD